MKIIDKNHDPFKIDLMKLSREKTDAMRREMK